VAIYRQNIIKYITDRPGQVVYRQDIENDLDLGATQVTAAILYVQKESPIGAEIETVMRGNAWRYTPSQPLVSSNGESAADPSQPLVSLIRQYLIERPHTPVTVDDLVAYTGRRPDQIKVGVNNMKHIKSNGNFTPYVVTLIQGQMWRFDPPPNWHPYRSPVATPSSIPTPPVTPVRQSRKTVPASVDPSTDDVRLFEEVGTAGDTIIIRDGDNNMYRATPL